MIKIFQRWARVKELFISRKLNKWGRRFGFVRFFEVGNVGRLEKELDQIYIENMKLHVNIPRYQRNELVLNKEVRRDVRNLHKEEPRDTRNSRSDEPVANMKKKGKEVWMEKKEKKILC